ncbi:RNA polymerase II transcription factor SIII subunit A-domain-containing protein [Phascolomyces articulosus]|uniref:RNA polymerase II transcription factor SIII subunit A-domain-containing protein n=1 Tax=Phascolomyces articulosus TaxID=60185 RepID=A0AAD5KEB2_9FUNG|nr:RNA polymerase II transcription factor SIII subunit A-domain-containing protein [Phascolomyces articulosus]
MPKEIKSLVTISQEILSRHLEGLDDVGSTPYSLLKPALRKATPKQLLRIEKANPHLKQESNELWLNHCFSYTDIREAYHQGRHQDPTKWRKTYMQRFKETERKREMISAKVKKQYTKIQNEKAARSIKVLSGVVPTHGRGSSSYDAARRSQTSKLFQETRRAANKTHAMYRPSRQHHRPMRQPSSFYVPSSTLNSTSYSSSSAAIVPVSKPSSSLSRAYNNLKQRHMPLPEHTAFQPLIPPPHRIELPPRQVEKKDSPMKSTIPLPIPTISSSTPKRRRIMEGQSKPKSPSSSTSSPIPRKGTSSKKPVALVNYDIFKQLS